MGVSEDEVEAVSKKEHMKGFQKSLDFILKVLGHL